MHRHHKQKNTLNFRPRLTRYEAQSQNLHQQRTRFVSLAPRLLHHTSHPTSRSTSQTVSHACALDMHLSYLPSTPIMWSTSIDCDNPDQCHSVGTLVCKQTSQIGARCVVIEWGSVPVRQYRGIAIVLGLSGCAGIWRCGWRNTSACIVSCV